jgi:hypothetical protein
LPFSQFCEYGLSSLRGCCAKHGGKIKGEKLNAEKSLVAVQWVATRLEYLRYLST